MSANSAAVSPRPGEAAPLVAGVDSMGHRSTARQQVEPRSAAGFSAFWPMLVFFLAWFTWAIFQGYQLTEERKNLIMLKSGQQAQVEQAQKVRQTLDALGTETQKLADAGNANAKLVIDELRKKGVTVNRLARESVTK